MGRGGRGPETGHRLLQASPGDLGCSAFPRTQSHCIVTNRNALRPMATREVQQLSIRITTLLFKGSSLDSLGCNKAWCFLVLGTQADGRPGGSLQNANPRAQRAGFPVKRESQSSGPMNTFNKHSWAILFVIKRRKR